MKNKVLKHNADYNEWFRYAKGYLDSVRMLTYGINESNRWNEPSLVIPLLNLFFHYIEIMIKGILLKNGIEVETKHDLQLLFNKAKPLFMQCVEHQGKIKGIENPVCEKDIDDFQVLINVVGKFHNCHHFRYPNFEFNTKEQIIQMEYDQFLESLVRVDALLDSCFEDLFRHL